MIVVVIADLVYSFEKVDSLFFLAEQASTISSTNRVSSVIEHTFKLKK
jgi:hypothetical protein